ncbi:hypothetical protein [Streptomyces collinus]|uniref:hypothetical protein n=1 Tax=Streptomyces collinus TaxID=42684 RepID=UPI0036AF2974
MTAGTPDAAPGFILTRGSDVHGRCIALAGSGVPPGPSGLEIDVDESVLRMTVNHHMVATGLAHPTFYRSLFTSLRAELATVARQARESGLGNGSPACFPAFLAGVQDRYSILSTGERRAGLQHVVEITDGQTLKMTRPAEDLIFDEA